MPGAAVPALGAAPRHSSLLRCFSMHSSIHSLTHSFIPQIHIEPLLHAGDILLAGNVEEKEFLK